VRRRPCERSYSGADIVSRANVFSVWLKAPYSPYSRERLNSCPGLLFNIGGRRSVARLKITGPDARPPSQNLNRCGDSVQRATRTLPVLLYDEDALLNLVEEDRPVNRRKALAVISFAAPASAKPIRFGKRKAFLGVWRLVSCESKQTPTGAVQYPYGNNPIGRLTYDASGRMSAQIMKPDRRTSVAATAAASAIAEISAEEMREVLAGYIAYFGTFDVDESRLER
jgi:hypothetical protein